MASEPQNINFTTPPGPVRPLAPRPGRLLWIRLLLMCCCIAFSAYQPANDSYTEYKLKAAFLYNFIQYIDWGNQPAEYVIGILGNSPIEAPLQEIARTQTSSNKHIVVKHCNGPAEAAGCNILFIPRDSSIPLDDILEKIPKGVLTVGEKPGSASRGAAINFVIVDNKLRFESNLKALNSAGLKASSQLLKLAILVGK
jgi:hypothetical protein